MRLALLKPFFLMARNRFWPSQQVPWRGMTIGIVSLGICLAIYLATFKVVGFFHKQNELGIILSLKIFQMVWITIFAMLVFSCMVSAVSALFLSRDNEIVFAAPVSPTDLYFMRFSTIFFYTSWMMILFSLPVFVAFGRVFDAGPFFWPVMLLATIATALSAVGFGSGLTVILVNIFPAKRTKDIVFYLSLCFAVFIYAMFRLMRPEDLANPDKFAHFIDYLASISGPTGPYIPGGWAADLLVTYLLDREIDWLLLGLVVVTPFSLYFIGEWLMSAFFFAGYSKAQESFGGYRRFRGRTPYSTSSLLWMLRKEAKTFLRDSAEWSQLFMIGALVVVYLYNFKALPLDRSFWREEYLANLIAFLNIGLTAFVVTSLSARFVFPSVGAEGEAFFIIRSSPLSMSRFLGQKYIFYCIPFTILSLLLVIASDNLLKIEGPLWWISLIVSTLLTWLVVGLALGFGSIYADFKVENKAAAIGSIGAILFLLSSLVLEGIILIAVALPTYHITKMWLNGVSLVWLDFAWLFVWGGVAIGLGLMIVVRNLKKGVELLEKR